jgi:hypothetical protein
MQEGGMTLSDRIENWIVVTFIKACVLVVVWYYKILEWVEK